MSFSDVGLRRFLAATAGVPLLFQNVDYSGDIRMTMDLVRMDSNDLLFAAILMADQVSNPLQNALGCRFTITTLDLLSVENNSSTVTDTTPSLPSWAVSDTLRMVFTVEGGIATCALGDSRNFTIQGAYTSRMGGKIGLGTSDGGAFARIDVDSLRVETK